MICQMCGKNPASVHFTEIHDNKMTEMHLCEGCARGCAGAVSRSFTGRDGRLTCEV